MSYSQSHATAIAEMAAIEESDNTHSNVGSAILHGYSSEQGGPKGEVPAGETLMPGRLRKGIKTPRTRTDTLTRHYGSTGSGAK
jgi:hypothetical protein